MKLKVFLISLIFAPMVGCNAQNKEATNASKAPDSLVVLKDKKVEKDPTQTPKTQTLILNQDISEITYKGNTYIVCTVDPSKHTVDLFSSTNGGINFRAVVGDEAHQDKKFVFMMNGGKTDKDFKPMGLVIAEGKIQNKINLGPKGDAAFSPFPPSGVFYIDNNKKPHIVESTAFNGNPKNVLIATQSGPLLVVDGKSSEKLVASEAQAILNAVSIQKNNKLLFAISKEPVSYAVFAEFLVEKTNSHHALLLDEKVSQWYAPGNSTKNSNEMGTMITVSESQKPPQEEYAETEINDYLKRVTFLGKNYIVCEVATKDINFHLLNEIDERRIHDFNSINAEAKEEKAELIFAMNAGMFDQRGKPIGLFISEGKVSHDVNLKKGNSGNFYALPPNGIFALDAKDKLVVLPTANFIQTYKKPEDLKLATQSGPMMVIGGKFNKAFNEGSPNLNIRNGVGVNEKGNAVFIISEDKVNFYEFSQLFLDKMGCKNALYLDGVVSQWFAPGVHEKSNSQYDIGPIIALTKK